MITLRSAFALFGLVAACLPTSDAFANRIQATFRKTAASGHTLRLGFFYSINPDCTSRGQTIMRIVQSPSQGMLVKRNASEFATLPSNDLAAACNTRRVAGTLLEYRSATGFMGQDIVSIDAVFPTGNERLITYEINVQ